MNIRYKCPVCQDELHNLKCENEECSFDVLMVGDRAEPTLIVNGLANSGLCYIDKGIGLLVIKGPNFDLSCPLNSPASASVNMLHRYIITEFHLVERDWPMNSTRDLLNSLSKCKDFPSADFTGEGPMLVVRNGKLVFPVTKHPATRFVSTTLGTYQYRGPVYKPQYHGGIVEEWLNSFRFVADDDKEILRQWVVSALIQDTYIAGGSPGLLLVGREGCNIGKSESAKMIGAIFGDVTSVTWQSREDRNRNLDRELLGGQNKFLLIDNLSQKNIPVIDEPKLAAYLTKSKLTTKKLYGTGQEQTPKIVMDIITANSPVISPELLSRVLCVGLTNKKPKTINWVETWKQHKTKILEELMHIVITNWNKEPAKLNIPEDFRFTAWYAVTARALGLKELVLYPKESCVGSPLDVMIDQVLSATDDTEIRLSALPAELKALRTSTARLFKKQNPKITEEVIRMFLSRWSYLFDMVDEGDDTWIRLR
ncbi:MAG: hypothetical protein DRJ03_04695 [Chloroflexi bacterium]|nr:MAG: hypothetical protein DRJ03_04695 [Chloroflexota bacterium]